MTKKVKELRQGDHLDGESSPVHQVCPVPTPFPSADPQLYVLMEDGNWREFPAEREVELKPRTVAAKDAEGWCVCVYSANGAKGPFKVVHVSHKNDFVILSGWIASVHAWRKYPPDTQLEVVDNA